MGKFPDHRRGSWLAPRLGVLAAFAAGVYVGYTTLPRGRLETTDFLILGGSWLAAAALIMVPHGLRFGARPRDYLFETLALWGCLALPLVPLATAPSALRAPFPLLTVAVLVPLLAALAARNFGLTGRYWDTPRELPAVEGPALEAAVDAIEKAGLRPLSVRSMALPTLNGFVQGMRSAVVVLDRRAAETLAPGEIRALVAHEAGHLRLGGILPSLVLVSIAISLLAASCAFPRLQEVLLMACVAWLLTGVQLVRQSIEHACDRFAARIAGPADTAALLRSISADLPEGVRRWTDRLLRSALASHPPLGARLAAIGQGVRAPLLRFRALRAALFLGGLVLPVGIMVAGTLTPSGLPAPLAVCAWALALLPLALRILWTIGARGAARASFRATSFSARVSRLTISVIFAFLLAGVTAFIANRIERTTGDHPSWAPFAILACFIYGIIALVFGKRSRRLPREVAAAGALLSEGKPAEALEVVERGLGRRYRDPRLLALSGACKLRLGDLDGARTDLEEALQEDPRQLSARSWLCSVEMLSGNGERAGELARELAGKAPRDPLIQALHGTVALEAGRPEEAREAFDRSLALKERDAVALAGKGMALLETDGPGGRDEAERLVARAREIEPERPWVLLASARLAALAGDGAGAAALLERAIERLRATGFPGFVPYFEKLAARWAVTGRRTPA